MGEWDRHGHCRFPLCLESLEKQTVSKDDFEIILSNNHLSEQIHEGYIFAGNSRGDTLLGIWELPMQKGSFLLLLFRTECLILIG